MSNSPPNGQLVGSTSQTAGQVLKEKESHVPNVKDSDVIRVVLLRNQSDRVTPRSVRFEDADSVGTKNEGLARAKGEVVALRGLAVHVVYSSVCGVVDSLKVEGIKETSTFDVVRHFVGLGGAEGVGGRDGLEGKECEERQNEAREYGRTETHDENRVKKRSSTSQTL